MEKCRVLKEYMIFVDKVKLYKRNMDLTLAVTKAVDECIEEHVLEDFMKSQKARVISMSVLEFNIEKQLGFAKEEGKIEGHREGEYSKAIQIARNLIGILDIPTIAQKTGLMESEVLALKNEIESA